MAIDKNNPVDRKEFVAMQQVVGASGAGAATATQYGTVKKAATVAALTNIVGTADTALVDVGAAFSQTILNNNFADVATQINAILTALKGAGIMA